jgi:hypothetical protein
MSSTSETGHSKNVANLEEMISYINGYGTSYNPSKNAIKSPALNTLLANSKTAVTAVNSAMPAYSNAVSARESAFEPLSKLITRVFNSLVATDTTEQVNDSAKTLVRKIQGRRASKKLTEEEIKALADKGENVTQISSSQMSYDNRLDNLDKLIKLLLSVSLYSPNEADLKPAALTTLYNDLKTKNSAVISATIPLSNARISRNDILYKENTGLVSIANDVKTYIKSVFGATSPQYKQISALKFTTPR